MGTMSRTEGVVDVKVEGSSKLFDETRFVLFFFLVETSVFEKDDITFLSFLHNFGDIVTDAVGSKSNVLSEEFTKTHGAGSKGELVLGTILRATQVRADRDNGTLALQVFDSGNRRADTGVVGDLLTVEGDIQVATNKNTLSLKVGVRQVFDGSLGIQLHGNREGTDTEVGRGSESSSRVGRSEKSEDSGSRELHGIDLLVYT
mmetsp:Transcript_10810/g.20813  ORF Transcript_10810/g.20813 Transcript_10810/m.20813 type:complete len:203 (-) Transcript_10810:18-626(-)